MINFKEITQLPQNDKLDGSTSIPVQNPTGAARKESFGRIYSAIRDSLAVEIANAVSDAHDTQPVRIFDDYSAAFEFSKAHPEYLVLLQQEQAPEWLPFSIAPLNDTVFSLVVARYNPALKIAILSGRFTVKPGGFSFQDAAILGETDAYPEVRPAESVIFVAASSDPSRAASVRAVFSSIGNIYLSGPAEVPDDISFAFNFSCVIK